MPATKSPRKRNPPAQATKLKKARTAEATARKRYDNAKKRTAACKKAERKEEVNLANKQLARIRIQYP